MAVEEEENDHMNRHIDRADEIERGVLDEGVDIKMNIKY